MRKNKLFLKAIVSLLCVMSLSACTNGAKNAELHAYVERIKLRKIKDIEPLPEVKPYETFSYTDSTRRSPFVPSMQPVVKNAIIDNGIHPDEHRRKEPLESFPLDSLRMVGTVEKQGKRWALILDTAGTLHRITKGNYVGQNDGKVDDITDEKILVTEIVPEPSGGWREKKASMALKEDGPTQKTGANK